MFLTYIKSYLTCIIILVSKIQRRLCARHFDRLEAPPSEFSVSHLVDANRAGDTWLALRAQGGQHATQRLSAPRVPPLPAVPLPFSLSCHAERRPGPPVTRGSGEAASGLETSPGWQEPRRCLPRPGALRLELRDSDSPPASAECCQPHRDRQEKACGYRLQIPVRLSLHIHSHFLMIRRQ